MLKYLVRKHVLTHSAGLMQLLVITFLVQKQSVNLRHLDTVSRGVGGSYLCGDCVQMIILMILAKVNLLPPVVLFSHLLVKNIHILNGLPNSLENSKKMSHGKK